MKERSWESSPAVNISKGASELLDRMNDWMGLQEITIGNAMQCLDPEDAEDAIIFGECDRIRRRYGDVVFRLR